MRDSKWISFVCVCVYVYKNLQYVAIICIESYIIFLYEATAILKEKHKNIF